MNWCADFFQNRYQRIKLGPFKSSWRPTHAGVPQGTRLHPLFFLVMINDLIPTLPMYKYIDDCTVSEIVSVDQNRSFRKQMDYISQWTSSNNMRLNVKKTKEFRISFLKSQPLLEPLTANNQPIELVQSVKRLGVILSSDLKWSCHIEHVCSKASKRLYALRTLRRSGVPTKDLCSVYCSFIRPVLEYACPVWHSSLTLELRKQLEDIL